MQAVVDAQALARQVTMKVTVKGARRLATRLRLAAAIIRLAAWMAGTTPVITIEID